MKLHCLLLMALAFAAAFPACRPPAPPPAESANPIEAIAADLARSLGQEPVTCIAVSEALGPGDGGRERSDFGTYILTPIASAMQKLAPAQRFVRLEDCPKYSAAWMRAIALTKADAVLEGKYVPGAATLELTIEVTRPLGQTLASSHRQIPATPEYRTMADHRLPPIRPHESDKAALQADELKGELFHAAPTDPAIKVTIRPLRSPVPMAGSIRFIVTSSINGYLSVLYQGSSGKLDFLVPNPFVERVAVRAGEALVLPTPDMTAKGIALEATPPAGWERIKAVVSRDPIAWPRDASGNVPTDTEARLRAIAEVLKGAKFGEARCELETRP